MELPEWSIYFLFFSLFTLFLIFSHQKNNFFFFSFPPAFHSRLMKEFYGAVLYWLFFHSFFFLRVHILPKLIIHLLNLYLTLQENNIRITMKQMQWRKKDTKMEETNQIVCLSCINYFILQFHSLRRHLWQIILLFYFH